MHTLILTVYLSVSSSMGGYAAMATDIQKVEGFKNYRACKVAAEKWLMYTKAQGKSAVCVKLD